MKILLLKPGLFEDDSKNLVLDPSTLPPLGLLYLGAVLEQEGHSVEILDYSMKSIPREQLKNILMSSDAVGMTICSDVNFKPYLNISKMIIEKLGGKIGFDTETDKGSTFYFKLPLAT